MRVLDRFGRTKRSSADCSRGRGFRARSLSAGSGDGPDPTGLLALRQAWEVTAPGGSLVTLAVQNGDVDIGAIVTDTRPLEEVREAFQGVADRTELGVVIVFPG